MDKELEGHAMSNVIRFLAALGSNALSAAEYFSTVSLLDIDAKDRQALARRDHHALSEALGGRETMRCLIFSNDET